MKIPRNYRKLRKFPNLSMGNLLGKYPIQIVGSRIDIVSKFLLYAHRFDLEISEQNQGSGFKTIPRFKISDDSGKLTLSHKILFWEPK